MSRSLTTFIQILAGNIVLRLSLAKTRGRVLELHPFNNVTDLLRKLLISKSVVVLARDSAHVRRLGRVNSIRGAKLNIIIKRVRKL